QQDQHVKHEEGLLELGRGSKREARRVTIKDASVSRDHLAIEELPGNRIRLRNLSQSQPVKVPGKASVAIGGTPEDDLPVTASLGETLIDIEVARPDDQEDTPSPALGLADTAVNQDMYLTVAEPVRATKAAKKPLLKMTSESPEPEKIAHW